MDNYESDYLLAPRCALPDLRYIAYAAGVVIVVLALVVVAVNRLRLW